ncbi:hypothetical protein [Longimicrobium sp.]|uniref:hypothetical protein n=1 Tax=Longimicrobium sp. TaxID=2029185 RepID=UPI002B62DA61|nr:hypothetical protein [Longimicrobium sp.]HSU12820.1 hypothetical protein [Longimicrobium sp.]
MSTQIEPSARAVSLPHRRTGAAEATSLSRDFGDALRSAMRQYVESMGGVPMMYQIGALAVQPVGSRIRVDGGAESCTVTALFPGIQVRAIARSPGGWFALVPTPGFRADGSAVLCSPGSPAPREALPEWLGSTPPVLL